MAYTPTNWENLPSTNVPINATNLNKIETELNFLETKIKTESFSVSVTPSTEKGTSGYGETTLDISSLNATKILGLTFNGSSTFMLWGIANNIHNNPTTLEIYGYRLAGTYAAAISTRIEVLYI